MSLSLSLSPFRCTQAKHFFDISLFQKHWHGISPWLQSQASIYYPEWMLSLLIVVNCYWHSMRWPTFVSRKPHLSFPGPSSTASLIQNYIKWFNEQWISSTAGMLCCLFGNRMSKHSPCNTRGSIKKPFEKTQSCGYNARPAWISVTAQQGSIKHSSIHPLIYSFIHIHSVTL